MPGIVGHRIEFQIALNGIPIQGLLHASIVTSNCFSSDSYALTFAMGPFPLGDITFWSSLSSAFVEIGAITAFDPTLHGLISGMVDTIHIDPIQGTVAIEGRDVSASMIDAYRQQDFVNQTASEVASTIALHHGLTPVVTATSSNVGRYYGDGYTRLSLGQFSRLRSDWDLMVQLARENSFDVFVQGSTLFFQPSVLPSDAPIRIAFRDVKAIRFERTLMIASNATARVQSWNSQSMAPYDSRGSNDSGERTQTSPTWNNQPFLFSASNFTSQQVTDATGRYTAELMRLGMLLHIEMPWDLTFSPRTEILVDETNSPLDTLYKIDNIERHYSSTSGSSQIIRSVIV